MKKILLLIVMAFNIISNAQEKKWDLSATGGLSLPIGSYSGTDIKNNNDGFSKPGYNAGIDASRLFTGVFGAFIRLSYIQNAIDTATCKSRFPTQIGGTPQSSWKMNYSTWNLFNVGIGPLISLNLSKKIVLFIKPEVGLSICSTPIISGSTTSTTEYNEGNSSIKSFFYSAHVGVKYCITDHVSINLIAGYFATTCKYSSTEIVTTHSIGTSVYDPKTLINYTTGISTININTGLSFDF